MIGKGLSAGWPFGAGACFNQGGGAFRRRFFSPGSQRWQNRQSRPYGGGGEAPVIERGHSPHVPGLGRVTIMGALLDMSQALLKHDTEGGRWWGATDEGVGPFSQPLVCRKAQGLQVPPSWSAEPVDGMAGIPALGAHPQCGCCHEPVRDRQ